MVKKKTQRPAVANALYRARKAKRMSQGPLSIASGITIRTISRIETGRAESITSETAEKLEKALGGNFEQFVKVRE